MFTFEYTIGVNEYGRPYVAPSKKTDKELDLIEHKFMGLELARTLITNTLISHTVDPIKRPLPAEEYERLKVVKLELDRICDIFASTIKEQMKLLNDTNVLLNPQIYDIQVDTVNELHGLNYNGIIYGDEIFVRKEGLRVLVIENGKIYELKDGIDNEHWYDTTGK